MRHAAAIASRSKHRRGSAPRVVAVAIRTASSMLLSEGLGSLLLAATVVGSGVMAERLSGGNTAIALLANTGATVAVLGVLIGLLGPISGAHFNPVRFWHMPCSTCPSCNHRSMHAPDSGSGSRKAWPPGAWFWWSSVTGALRTHPGWWQPGSGPLIGSRR